MGVRETSLRCRVHRGRMRPIHHRQSTAARLDSRVACQSVLRGAKHLAVLRLVRVLVILGLLLIISVGDALPFPSDDPHRPTLSATAPLEACAMSHELSVVRGYESQLWWNSGTGEPWMAVRCYADQAYPALSGTYSLLFSH